LDGIKVEDVPTLLLGRFDNFLPFIDIFSLQMYNCLTMMQLATITSKKQFTIPADIFRAAGFKTGQKILVTRKDRSLLLEPVEDIVENLAGSVRIPKKYRNLTIGKIKKKAIHDYFSNNKKK